MAKYKISVEAKNDLEKIWAYTYENWSVEQADRYIRQIVEEIEYVASNPNQGKDFSYVRQGYLRTKVKLHYIFYKIDNKNDLVEVIRVLHQRMDVENRLK